MRRALDLPKNGLEWQFSGHFSSIRTQVYMDGIREHMVHCSSSRVGHRAGIGRISEGREAFSIVVSLSIYCTIGPGPPIGPKVKGRLMSHSQKDLRGQKNLGPRTFGARRGRNESVHPARRGRGPGQDHARGPGSG